MIKPLDNYYKAEEYHQKYLDKNPNGYCHIGRKFVQAEKAHDPNRTLKRVGISLPRQRFKKKSVEDLKQSLTNLQFAVTQKNETEPPFRNPYYICLMKVFMR